MNSDLPLNQHLGELVKRGSSLNFDCLEFHHTKRKILVKFRESLPHPLKLKRELIVGLAKPGEAELRSGTANNDEDDSIRNFPMETSSSSTELKQL